MPDVWLVTGGSGFLGRHLLAGWLANRPADVEILAVGRRPVGSEGVTFVEQDLEDREGLTGLLATVRPTRVFHLAGKTPPGSASDFDRLNSGMTARLIESLVAAKSPCRLVLVGSAAELGPVSIEDLPVAEDYPCQPVEPYGRSKWQATRSGLAAPLPIEVVVARVFNPIGPALPTNQALGRFAKILTEGAGPVHLTVGDLDARRDFIDVRDVAAGLIALADRGRPGEVYHVGTGRSHAVREGLERLIALSGREVTIEVDPDLARSRGPTDSRANIAKIRRETGWSPQITWEQSLDDLWLAASERLFAGLTDLSSAV